MSGCTSASNTARIRSPVNSLIVGVARSHKAPSGSSLTSKNGDPGISVQGFTATPVVLAARRAGHDRQLQRRLTARNLVIGHEPGARPDSRRLPLGELGPAVLKLRRFNPVLTAARHIRGRGVREPHPVLFVLTADPDMRRRAFWPVGTGQLERQPRGLRRIIESGEHPLPSGLAELPVPAYPRITGANGYLTRELPCPQARPQPREHLREHPVQPPARGLRIALAQRDLRDQVRTHTSQHEQDVSARTPPAGRLRLGLLPASAPRQRAWRRRGGRRPR